MTTHAPERPSTMHRMRLPERSPTVQLRLRSLAGATTKARTAPAAIRTAANATTVTAPVGASSRKEPNIPTALATAPATQPTANATPIRDENKPPTKAGTMRQQNTSRHPAVLTEEVTNRP